MPARRDPAGRPPNPQHGPRIPPPLVEAILAGDCVAFVGAGFSAAAGLPPWDRLLEDLAAAAQLTRDERARFDALLQRRTGHTLDQAAQLLEDRLQRGAMVRLLVDKLATPSPPEVMRRRLWLLQRIPFRAILTTNFDPLLPGKVAGPAAYFEVLRPSAHRWWEDTFWDEKRWPPAVQLHGSLAAKPPTDIVLTWRDYRRRLYQDSAYMTFLRATLATTTVLYLGFSFEDAYLNELRSEVLAMLAHGAEKPPLAYAVANDVPGPTIELFRRHEGIEVLPYAAAGGDHSGFDGYLEVLYRETNPLPRFARFLRSRRLLWVDPRPENNEAGLAFLARAAREGGDAEVVQVGTADEALVVLERARNGAPVDLVVTHWGEPGPRYRAAAPTAVTLLEECDAGTSARRSSFSAAPTRAAPGAVSWRRSARSGIAPDSRRCSRRWSGSSWRRSGASAVEVPARRRFASTSGSTAERVLARTRSHLACGFASDVPSHAPRIVPRSMATWDRGNAPCSSSPRLDPELRQPPVEGPIHLRSVVNPVAVLLAVPVR
jgi:hypothetical protein